MRRPDFQRDERQGVIFLRFAARPLVPIHSHHRLPVPAEGVLSRDAGAHTRAANDVDRNAVFLQRADHTNVGETASAAAAQDQTDGSAGDPARQLFQFLRPIQDNMVMSVDANGFPPAVQLNGCVKLTGVQEHQLGSGDDLPSNAR